VDILPPDADDLTGHKLVLAPGAVTLSEPFKTAIAAHDGPVILGPRSNAKTAEMHIPVPLPPAIPGLDVTVSRVESLRPDMPRPVDGGGHVQLWQEELEGTAEVTLRGTDGQPLAMTNGRITYLGAWLDSVAMTAFLRDALAGAGLNIADMPGGLRRRQAGATEFLINYDPEPQVWDGLTIPAAGVVWR